MQFGVDPTRSGVVETPVAQTLSTVLGDAEWPLQIGELRDMLVDSCDVDSTAARSLIDDLCSYRVLIPDEANVVAVLGTTPLAREIRRLLSASGATVRIPMISEDTTGFLERQASSPLIVVDRAHEYWTLGQELRRHPSWVLPVLSFDSRVIVGPVGRANHHACPVCALMRLHDRDPLITQVMDDVSGRPRSMDPVVMAAGAAAAVLAVRRLAGIPDPPGVIAKAPDPGWAAVVDPLGPRPLSPLHVGTHPRCPVCAAEQ